MLVITLLVLKFVQEAALSNDKKNAAPSVNCLFVILVSLDFDFNDVKSLLCHVTYSFEYIHKCTAYWQLSHLF